MANRPSTVDAKKTSHSLTPSYHVFSSCTCMKDAEKGDAIAGRDWIEALNNVMSGTGVEVEGK